MAAPRQTAAKKATTRKAAAKKTTTRAATVPVKGTAARKAPTAAKAAAVKKAAAANPVRAKATAARAAAAKAQGRRYAPAAELAGQTPPPQAEPEPDTQPAEQPTVTFRGRTMKVQLPSAEALAVMQRLGQRFAAADTTKMNMEQAAKLADRAIGIITSVVIDDDDREWLEGEFLDGLLLEEASVILRDTVAAVRGSVAANRAERRAARTT